MNDKLAKITARTAAEIVTMNAAFGEEARALLQPAHTPTQYVDALISREQFREAIRFLAFALPKPEAIWWGCLCVRNAYGADVPPKAAAVLDAAEKWLRDPLDVNRRAAMSAAQAADLSTPAGFIGFAIFFSDGSLGPPGGPLVRPPETSTGQGLTAAIQIAAVVTEPHKAAEKLRTFVALGMEVANGTSRWK